jgi:hypothetical protein
MLEEPDVSIFQVELCHNPEVHDINFNYSASLKSHVSNYASVRLFSLILYELSFLEENNIFHEQ